MLTIMYPRREMDTDVKYIVDDAPQYESAPPRRHIRRSGYLQETRLGVFTCAFKVETRIAETAGTTIARLYEEIASLCERRASGDLGGELKREIERTIAELRRLQAAQAAEITRRFRDTLKLSREDFDRLDEADQILRDREDSSEPNGSAF